MGYKVYNDSYLISLTKSQIIEQLRVAEHNFFATEEALNNSVKAGMEIAKKYDEAKRLLRLAIYDIYNAKRGINCGICDMPKNDIDVEKRCEVDNVQPECKYQWRYADEALKLIGDSENDEP